MGLNGEGSENSPSFISEGETEVGWSLGQQSGRLRGIPLLRVIHLCLLAGSRHCPSLWAGTNGGTIYAFSLRVPPADRRMDEPVQAEQGEWEAV